jgi:hypothetical protein
MNVGDFHRISRLSGDDSAVSENVQARTIRQAYVIFGEPASKANSRRIVRRGRRLLSIKSEKALSYADHFRVQAAELDLAPLEGDVCVIMDIFYASRRPDLDESLILDLMQGVSYANDRQVKEKHIHWHLDRDFPRCHIYVCVI